MCLALAWNIILFIIRHHSFLLKITVRFGNRLDCSVRKNDQKFLAVRREAPATFVRFLLLSFIFQRNQYP